MRQKPPRPVRQRGTNRRRAPIARCPRGPARCCRCPGRACAARGTWSRGWGGAGRSGAGGGRDPGVPEGSGRCPQPGRGGRAAPGGVAAVLSCEERRRGSSSAGSGGKERGWGLSVRRCSIAFMLTSGLAWPKFVKKKKDLFFCQR